MQCNTFGLLDQLSGRPIERRGQDEADILAVFRSVTGSKDR